MAAILGFHKIGVPANGDYPTWNYVPVERLRAYLRALREAGLAASRREHKMVFYALTEQGHGLVAALTGGTQVTAR